MFPFRLKAVFLSSDNCQTKGKQLSNEKSLVCKKYLSLKNSLNDCV